MTYHKYAVYSQEDLEYVERNQGDCVAHCIDWALYMAEEDYNDAMVKYHERQERKSDLERRGIDLDYCSNWSDREIEDEVEYHLSG